MSDPLFSKDVAPATPAAPDYHEGRKPYELKEGKSQLPVWTVSHHDERGTLLIGCPRCEAISEVTPKWLMGLGLAKDHPARPCTYCFGTARLPEDVHDG